jgi:sulfatase modifying factor 1
VLSFFFRKWVIQEKLSPMKIRNTCSLFSLAGLAVVLLMQSALAEDTKPAIAPVDPMAWVKVSKQQVAAAKKLGVPVALTNSIGMRFALIPPGNFKMGSQDSVEEVHAKCIGVDVNPDWATDEHPVHKVKIARAFYMSIYEVEAKVLETVAPRPSETKEQKDAIKGRRRGDPKAKTPTPAINVWWQEAVTFCEQLGKQDSRTYRLPTEAEWEYACRAGTSTPFSFGETVLTNQVNCNHYYPYSKKGVAAPAWQAGPATTMGTYPPNAWGLHEMHGNVREWCSDWYAPYTKKSQTDPEGPATGTERVARGGGAKNSPAVCRSAKRGSYVPPSLAPSPHYGNRPRPILTSVGFRVVMELKK